MNCGNAYTQVRKLKDLSGQIGLNKILYIKQSMILTEPHTVPYQPFCSELKCLKPNTVGPLIFRPNPKTKTHQTFIWALKIWIFTTQMNVPQLYNCYNLRITIRNLNYRYPNRKRYLKLRCDALIIPQITRFLSETINLKFVQLFYIMGRASNPCWFYRYVTFLRTPVIMSICEAYFDMTVWKKTFWNL